MTGDPLLRLQSIRTKVLRQFGQHELLPLQQRKLTGSDARSPRDEANKSGRQGGAVGDGVIVANGHRI
jgi:hypothetical protein